VAKYRPNVTIVDDPCVATFNVVNIIIIFIDGMPNFLLLNNFHPLERILVKYTVVKVRGRWGFSPLLRFEPLQ